LALSFEDRLSVFGEREKKEKLPLRKLVDSPTKESCRVREKIRGKSLVPKSIVEKYA